MHAHTTPGKALEIGFVLDSRDPVPSSGCHWCVGCLVYLPLWENTIKDCPA